MRTLLAALFVAALSSTAEAAVYLSAGYRASGIHAGYQSVESKGISGGISVDLGAYIRLGYTYEDSFQKADGYEDPLSAQKAGHVEADGVTPHQYRVASAVHTKTNSIDLQIVLYPGTTVTPYLIGGAAMRDSLTTSWDPDLGQFTQLETKDPIPVPQGGLGLQVQMNAACSLTLQYIVSPGVLATPVPGDPDHPQVKKFTDGAGSIGLKYKI